MFTVKINIGHTVVVLKGLKRELSPREVDTALARAINRVTVTGRKEASKDIRQTYRIKARRLTARMKIKTATRFRPTGRISTTGAPIPLSEFRPTQGKAGVRVNIKGQRKLIPHAFIAKMPKSGYKGVFMRGHYKTTGFEYKPGGRLPITKLTTVGEGAMFGNPIVVEKTLDRIDEVLPKRFAHELKFLASGIR